MALQRRGLLLHDACRRGNRRAVLRILNGRVNVNFRNIVCRTPLHVATRRGFVRIVEELLSHGSDTNARDNFGRTPLYEACIFGREEIAKLLLAHRADTEIPTSTGSRPIHPAMMRRNVGLVEVLLNAGAFPDAPNDKGQSPLHIACSRNDTSYMSIFNLLIEFGASVNTVNRLGCTPLHEACNYKNKEYIYILLQLGADMNKRDNNGISPLKIVFSYLMPPYPFNADELLICVGFYIHVAKARSIGNTIDPNVSSQLEDFPVGLLLFQSDCQEEVKKLKTNFIIPSFSYYEFLKLSDYKLTSCLRNTEISDVLLERSFKRILPLYSVPILNKLRVGLHRRQLLDDAISVLFNTFGKVLPLDIVEMIVEYLSNGELRTISYKKPYRDLLYREVVGMA